MFHINCITTSITGELGTPYVIKNGKKIPLYISEYNEEE